MPIKKHLDEITRAVPFETGNESFIESFRKNLVNENSKFAMKSGRNFISSNDDNDTCDI